MRCAAAGDGILAEAGWKRRRIMSGTGWLFTGLGILYLVLLFTLAVLSFRKGHWVLGLIGFIFPILWIIGAILPDRRRRRYR
jgi:cadmium resistance protein CadD (predicted permease)